MQKRVFKVIFVFLGAYLIFLILWINIKDYYGYAITYTTSNLAMVIKDSEFKGITKKEDVLEAIFSRYTYRGEILIRITINTSTYTFNVPLTYAIMAALYLFIKRRRRAYLEAILILLSVHILYVFSLEAKGLTELFMGKGLEPINKVKLFVYQFLWSFTDNMVIRFEPFLIGFYVFLRFRD